MKTIHVVGAAIIAPPYVLAFRRGQHTTMAGKWEFPGGKVESGETPKEALYRELEEELQLKLTIGPQLGTGSAEVQPGVVVKLDVFEVVAPRGALHYTLSDHDAAKWVDVEDLMKLDWADADIPVLKPLRARLQA